MDTKPSIEKVKKYFNTLESRLGYVLVTKGRKHFGFYPEGRERITMLQAQQLMEDNLAIRLNCKNNSTVFDAGCGEGKVATYLAKKYNLNVVGVDLLDWAIKKAKENASHDDVQDKVDFKVMDYTDLKFPDQTFDGVYTMETLVHVPDHRKALRQFYRVLKPKGKLVLFEYSISPEKDIPDNLRMFSVIIKESAMHSLPYFVHGSFPQLLKKAGFRNTKIEDVTLKVMPMLKSFHSLAYYPYQIIKLFNLQKYFVNTTAGFIGKDLADRKIWRYNIITATKPA